MEANMDHEVFFLEYQGSVEQIFWVSKKGRKEGLVAFRQNLKQPVFN
jgi:hypothetical protein